MKKTFATVTCGCIAALTSHYASALELAPVLISEYKMTPNELNAFQGQYLMENGATLTVVKRNRRLLSTLANQPQVELVATSPNSFVTKPGAVKVAFRQAANGNVFGVELRQDSTTLAQR